MRVVTPVPRFNLTVKAPDRAQIFLLFHYWNNGERLRLKKIVPGVVVDPAYFDKRVQRMKRDRSNPNLHIRVNETIEEMSNHVTQIYREAIGRALTPQQFGEELEYRMLWKPRPVAKVEKVPSLFEFIPLYIAEKEAVGKKRPVLGTAFTHLKNYAAANRRSGVLDYTDLDAAFFADFQRWCFEPPRSHSINFFARLAKVLKEFLRESNERGYHTNTSFKSFSVKTVKVSKLALTFEELERMYALDLSAQPRLERVRDLFLIGCYTGMRISDFKRIRPEHIKPGEGIDYIDIFTRKGITPAVIPLLPIPWQLLKKYNFVAPQISDQKLNDYIKEVGEMAGLTEQINWIESKGGKVTEATVRKCDKISSHVARRSFASNFYYDLQVPAFVLMQITTHTTEKQFLEYVVIGKQRNADRLAELVKGDERLKAK